MCNKNRRGWAFALLCIAFLCAGCSREEKTAEKKSEEPVKIPVVFRVDPATNVSNNLEFVEEFNALYEGRYVVEVEWLTESTAGYRERLKQWNVLDEMPAVITDAGFDYDFYRLLVEERRLVDLRPYIWRSPQNGKPPFEKRFWRSVRRKMEPFIFLLLEVRFSLTQELFITKNFWRRLDMKNFRKPGKDFLIALKN